MSFSSRIYLKIKKSTEMDRDFEANEKKATSARDAQIEYK